MAIRESNADDGDRIRELVESSMTASYRLSPQQIDNIVERQFGDDRLTEGADGDDVLVVAETDTTDDERIVAGFFWGGLADGRGTIRWLFVDPEQRGQGIGTELFEEGVERLRDAGTEGVQAVTLQAGMDGHQFCEQFGYEQVDERQVDIGDETLAQYVYQRSDADESSTDTST